MLSHMLGRPLPDHRLSAGSSKRNSAFWTVHPVLLILAAQHCRRVSWWCCQAVVMLLSKVAKFTQEEAKLGMLLQVLLEQRITFHLQATESRRAVTPFCHVPKVLLCSTPQYSLWQLQNRTAQDCCMLPLHQNVMHPRQACPSFLLM